MPALSDLLGAAVAQEASDLHLKVGAPPHVRVGGVLSPLALPPLTAADTAAVAAEAMPANRQATFDETGEADFALSLAGVGRFRVNVHRQRGSVGLVVRRVLSGTPQLDDLGLPVAVGLLADAVDGLVLVTGPARSGKSTTLAAMVDRINSSRACSILTVEDPVEVLHTDKRSIITQREVGTDTPSHASALAHVWHQAPDVVVVTELRDADTIQAALTLAETGHLVLAGMSTTGAAETVARLLELFPTTRHGQLRSTLARVLRGVVSQRLLPRTDGRGLAPAVEVLLGTERVAERIVAATGPVAFADLIEEGELHGMQTLDQHLFALVRDGVVELRRALTISDDPRGLEVALGAAVGDGW